MPSTRKRRIYHARPDREWRASWSRAHWPRAYLALYPVPVRRPVLSDRASSGPRLTATPLPSPFLRLRSYLERGLSPRKQCAVPGTHTEVTGGGHAVPCTCSFGVADLLSEPQTTAFDEYLVARRGVLSLVWSVKNAMVVVYRCRSHRSHCTGAVPTEVIAGQHVNGCFLCQMRPCGALWAPGIEPNESRRATPPAAHAWVPAAHRSDCPRRRSACRRRASA